MLGSWAGFALGIVSFPAWESSKIFLLNPISWVIPFVGDFFSYGLLFYVIALFTLPVVFFVYGWIIHAVLRKIGRENPGVIIILVSMLVILPTVYGLIKDQQTFQAALKSADSDIHAAKALPEGTQRTGEDFRRESVAMNAIMVMAKAETDVASFMDKMMSIARNESIAIDVRLTALDSLSSKVSAMSSDQKKNLSDQLVSFDTSYLSGADKERMVGRITNLQKLLAQ